MVLEAIEVSKTYKVKLDDCCIQGYFTSKLIKIVEPKDEYSDREWHFENGVVITTMYREDAFEEVQNV